jgi:uncharacterized protein (DUF342 family)
MIGVTKLSVKKETKLVDEHYRINERLDKLEFDLKRMRDDIYYLEDDHFAHKQKQKERGDSIVSQLSQLIKASRAEVDNA